jgi:hypothetical protein
MVLVAILSSCIGASVAILHSWYWWPFYTVGIDGDSAQPAGIVAVLHSWYWWPFHSVVIGGDFAQLVLVPFYTLGIGGHSAELVLVLILHS